MEIVILVLAVIAASIIDSKKDKTTFAAAWKTNFVKYGAMAVGGFLISSVPAWMFGLLIAAGIYYFWTLVSQIVISLYNKVVKKPS